MIVRNDTLWRTDHLKAILQRAAEIELEPAKRKVLHVTVSYTRGAHSSGCAVVGGRHATIRIRHPFTRARGRQSLDAAAHDELLHRFASVASHEFAHIRGMEHDVMPNKYKWAGRWEEYVAWVQGMPLEVKAPNVAAKPTVDAKLSHVRSMLKKAESRVRRANTLLKKWRAKERYYLRAMAAQSADSSSREDK